MTSYDLDALGALIAYIVLGAVFLGFWVALGFAAFTEDRDA